MPWFSINSVHSAIASNSATQLTQWGAIQTEVVSGVFSRRNSESDFERRAQ
jgi:hypothetical protein